MACSRRLLVCLALVTPVLLARDAQAENGIKPRHPVEWEPPVACLEFVDRSADPVYRFSYAIPDEDPSPGEQLLEDEVADSRTHQFFAMARQGNPQTRFPKQWITPADVAAALEKELIADTTVGPEDTLETNPFWSDHFERITPDDQRRPIAHESVAEPVEWDTTAVNAGPYLLWGYTWEPAFNLWSARTGNLVIVHDGDPTDAGPAAVVTNGELIVYSDEAAIIEGCAFGSAGTTLDGYFAQTPDNGTPDDWEPTWIQFADDVPLDGESFALEMLPGEEFATNTLLVRIVANDPSGATYEAHAPELVSVLPGQAGNCDDGGSSIIGNPGCGSDSSSGGASETDGDSDDGTSATPTSGGSGEPTSGGSAGSDGSTSGSAGGSGGTSTGGGCTLGGGAPSALLLLGLLGFRRRRP